MSDNLSIAFHAFAKLISLFLDDKLLPRCMWTDLILEASYLKWTRLLIENTPSVLFAFTSRWKHTYERIFLSRKKIKMLNLFSVFNKEFLTTILKIKVWMTSTHLWNQHSWQCLRFLKVIHRFPLGVNQLICIHKSLHNRTKIAESCRLIVRYLKPSWMPD